jgi:hypothetical protein
MRWFSIAILLFALVGFTPAKSAEAADFAFSVGFHDELSPYGTWFSYSNYGSVWRPYAYSGWRPYTDGYWGYTSYGPTWYGNEAYSPYVYHYGNWIYTARYGWVWIPGYDWHAGRVDWTYGGGYIGWRPQFPSGYSYPGSDYNLWIVIDANRFGDRSYRPYALRATTVRDLFNRRVFRERRASLRRTDLERIVRRPVREISLRERDVQIGNRKARLLVTPDEEVRIRKHVTQVRVDRDRDKGKKVVERTTIERKDKDFGTKSKSKTVTKVEKKPSHTTNRSTVSVQKRDQDHGKSKQEQVRSTKREPVRGKAKVSSHDHGKKTQVTKSKKKVVQQKKEKPKKHN